MARKRRASCPRIRRTRSTRSAVAQPSAAPVPYITESRDRLFDLTAGPGRARADPVSTRDAVAVKPRPAGQHRPAWAVTSCRARRPSLLASHLRCPADWPAGQFPNWRTACQRRAPARCFGCVTVLQLSVVIPVIPDHPVKGFAEPAPGLRCCSYSPSRQAVALVKVLAQQMASWAAQNHLMKLSWDITRSRGWSGCGPQ